MAARRAFIFGCLMAAMTAWISLPVCAQRESAQPYRYDQRGGDQPGDFDYYTLVLSWSPTHCATLPRNGAQDPQCNRRDGRRYAFVLHGLWPQHERGYPEFCRTRTRPYVPQSIIDAMQDIMPSPRLTIHEYRKHGTCSGLDPAGYYGLSRRLFGRIKIPSRYVDPLGDQFVSPDGLVDEFIAQNPSLKQDMIVVSCGGPGNRLKEVRVCFDKLGDPRVCGRNEDQRRLCRSPQMHVPPVRSSAERPGDTPRNSVPPRNRDRELPSPLPGPRAI